MAKAAAPDAIYEVAIAFSGPLGSFPAGAIYRGDDPVVRKFPQFFRPVIVNSTIVRTAEPVIEQATAAPGEKRGAR
jgi:hypothetical protein